MDVPTFFKEYDRMCSYHRNGCDCGDCPLIRFIEDQRGTCLEICKRYPEKSVAIVEQWTKEHPAKTYKSVFLEKFPDADMDAIIANTCIEECFGEGSGKPNCKPLRSCKECWNRWVEE